MTSHKEALDLDTDDRRYIVFSDGAPALTDQQEAFVDFINKLHVSLLDKVIRGPTTGLKSPGRKALSELGIISTDPNIT